MKNWILSSVVLLFLVYFLFYSIYGDRGVIAYFKWQNNLETARSTLDEVKGQKLEIEHKVKLLRPESLDTDMLDEQARKLLGVSKKTEQVFVANDEKTNQENDDD